MSCGSGGCGGGFGGCAFTTRGSHKRHTREPALIEINSIEEFVVFVFFLALFIGGFAMVRDRPQGAIAAHAATPPAAVESAQVEVRQ